MAKRKKTDFIIIHCSATKPHMDIGAKEIRQWHTMPPPKGNGWSDIGYHYVIRRNGVIEDGRNQESIGAHVKGYNSVSLGVCVVGGVDDAMKAEANFTCEQWKSLERILRVLWAEYPRAMICGHRDLDAGKECPSFDVGAWLRTSFL